MNTQELIIPPFFENERIHPQAEDAFRQARNMNIESQRHIFDALSRMFRRPSIHNADKVFAIRALARFIDFAPEDERSWRRYEAWRKTQPDGPSLPNASKIRRAFDGSWTEAIESVAVVPTLALTTLRRRRRNRPLSRHEILECAREWVADEEGRLNWRSFMAWTSARASLGFSVPQSRNAVIKKFADLRTLLHAVGLDDDEIERRLRAPEAYTDEELRVALDGFLAWNGGPGTLADYRRFCVSDVAPDPAPSSTSIYMRIGNGSWRELVERRWAALEAGAE